MGKSLGICLVVLAAAACGDDAGQGGAPDAQPATADAAPVTADAASAPDAAVPDTDFAVVRFTAGGELDTTFGDQGIAIVDTGAGAGTVRDNLYSAARDGEDRVVLFGMKKGDGRGDQDRVIVRLTRDGDLDEGFASGGRYTHDTTMLADNARHGIVEANGKILASGYTGARTGVGDQTANQIALIRLDASGAPDGTFGSGGVATLNPFVPADPVGTMWGMVEAYGALPHKGGYVTTGYGRLAPSGTVDMVSCRFGADGMPDLAWGDGGKRALDLVGENDRGRHLAVLPDDRVLVVGSGSPSASNIDAMLVMLTAEGDLDDSFDGDGHKLHSFGRADEAFFMAAVSPANDRVAVVGYRAGATGGPAEDEDGVLGVLRVDGTEVLAPAAAPASESLDDRWWAVAYDAQGRIYAAGVLTEGGDARFAVARFLADGARDLQFGQAGVAQVNVAPGGGTLEAARAVVIQSDGKIVLAGNAEKK
jgi:uncharacterized delta-60 repeat protein